MNRDELILDAITRGEYRVVKSSKRKKLLIKRGEHIWWDANLKAWVWDFWKLPF